MNIIVCVKQVPDTAEVKIDLERGTLIREGVPSIINPFDLHAIEEALRIRERLGGKVTLISMGPPQAEEAIRDGLAMGCDAGVLLTDKVFAGADTLATSYTLACGIRRIGRFDLIICGMKSVDGDTAQVGPGLAQELGIPHVAYVCKIDEISGEYIVVEKLLEDGVEVIKCPLPCLISVVKGINTPRLPSFKLKIASKKAEIKKWGSDDLAGDKSRYGLDGSPTRVVKVSTPEPRSQGEVIEGPPKDQALKLYVKLKELNMI